MFGRTIEKEVFTFYGTTYSFHFFFSYTLENQNCINYFFPVFPMLSLLNAQQTSHASRILIILRECNSVHYFPPLQLNNLKKKAFVIHVLYLKR